MNITDIAIRRPVMAWMAMGALIFFGFMGYHQMGISQMPDVDFPVLSISINYPGAAPEIIETDIVDVIEDAVMGVEGVRSLTSTCQDGSARISVEFSLNRNIDTALQEVQSKLATAQRLLPSEMNPPVITKTNPEDQPIMWLTVSSKILPRKTVMTYVRDVLKDKISSLDGVGNVQMGGYIEPALRVWVHRSALTRYDLTVLDVIHSIQSEHVELPAGWISNTTRQLNIRTLGEAQTVSDFETIRLNSRAGQPNFNPIHLSQVADIEDGLSDVQQLSRANGQYAVGLGIMKQRGSNAVEVSKGIKARVAKLQKELPPGMTLSIRIDTTKFIKDAVNDLLFTLILSILLTSFVCWLFLGSWSSTFNVLLAIPTSIVGTFIVLSAFHFTLNTFTVMALSLAIGIVVDDAIMVLENITRHAQMGQSQMESAQVGTREISFAALAATFSIVAIFLPVAFMNGIIGKFFFQFGVTMTVAVLLSLFEALTLTPMRCSQFLNVKSHETLVGRWFDKGFIVIRRLYAWLLAKALNRRGWVVFLSLIFFGISLVCAHCLRNELIPSQDQSMFLIRVKSPAGSSLQYTDERARKIEDFLMGRKDVEGYFVTVGGFGGNDPSAANIFVSLKPKDQRKISQTGFMNMARKQFKKAIPEVKVSLQDLSMRSFSTGMGYPVEFTVRGPNWETLGKSAMALYAKLASNPDVMDLNTDYLVGMKELDMIPNRREAASRGVNVASVAQTIQAMIGGSTVARYQSNGHRYDIIVKLPANETPSEDALLSGLYVHNNHGEMIPLSAVVSIQERAILQSITRKDRERAITIYGNIRTGASQAEVLSMVERTAKETLPPDYRIVFSGNAQSSRESMQGLVFALLLGILIAYMILASQFNSYKDPLVVLMALPFSVSGALIALLLANQSLSIYSMIGLILLMGIVKKNSILLVDFTIQMRQRGMGVRAALLEACPIRLRPILMTSLATIAAAIPPAIAMGPGAETRIPMAVTVIGGVLVSTLLTLFVVPCFYSLLEREKL